MFAAHEVVIETTFDVAAARLTTLIGRGSFTGACDAAYEGALTAVLRIGPFGPRWGFSKLVRVCLLEPVQRGTTLTVPVRWEATGAAGELFPVLDADLVLARDGRDRTHLALTGSYRPPFGRAGAVIDRAIMHHLATATIGSLLDNLSAALTSPAPQRGHAPQTALRPQPTGEPDGP